MSKVSEAHVESKSSIIEPRLDPNVIHNEVDLLAAAIHIDRYLMDAMNRLEKDFSEMDKLAMLTFKQLNSNKHILNDKLLSDKQVPGEDVTRSLEQMTLYNEQMEAKATTPISRLQQLCASCDSSIAFYIGIVEEATDDAVTLTAKKLASSALERVRILKQALGEECGCIVSAVK